MTVEQGATGAEGRIRATDRRLWIWTVFIYVGVCLAAAATFLANGHPLVALAWLTLACVRVPIALKQRSFGVDLTPQHAIVRGFRQRDVPWQEVQEVVSCKKWNGTSVVGLILTTGESVMLRAPTSFWREGDRQYERDFHRIDQYWLAHRWESFHPLPPEAPSPPTPE
jgi:hypothetical protein